MPTIKARISAAVVSILFNREATTSFRFCSIVSAVIINFGSVRMLGTDYSIDVRFGSFAIAMLFHSSSDEVVIQ
jgi:hypothetical protein